MDQKNGMLSKADKESVDKYKDKSIQQHIVTKLAFSINLAGTDINNIEEAINHAYRCGLASMASEQSTKSLLSDSVDQDELYKVLKEGHSIEHKADFLREIAKEWFPIELHGDKKIKTVNIELNELADFLENKVQKI